MLLDQAGVLQEVFLELGDVIQRGLGVLLAGDGKVELVLLLREQLEELRDLCAKILANPDADDGELDPTEGFFFGSTEKDEWYYQDLRDTVEGLTKCLELPKNYYFIYRSSW